MAKKLLSLEQLAQNGWEPLHDMSGKYVIVGRDNKRLMLKSADEAADTGLYTVAYSYRGYYSVRKRLPVKYSTP